MRFVIDRCCMDAAKLRDFLLLSPQHVAVLTDYSIMESLKGRTLENIESAWRVLRDFPDQIVVLKGTHEAALVRPQEAGLAQRMIDKVETRALSKIPKIIASARSGNEDSHDQLRKLGEEIDDHFDQILARSSDLPGSIKGLAAIFSASELKQLRKAGILDDEMVLKLLDLVVHQTADLCALHPDNPPMPGPKHLANHFCFGLPLPTPPTLSNWSGQELIPENPVMRGMTQSISSTQRSQRISMALCRTTKGQMIHTKSRDSC